MKTNIFRDGKVHVCQVMCGTCIFRPDTPNGWAASSSYAPAARPISFPRNLMMPVDETEEIRRDLLSKVNAVTRDEENKPRSESDVRADLEAAYGKVYNTRELSEHFIVLGFMAPFVIVRRKSDNVKGSLSFTHSPRMYFDFQPYNG